MIFTLILTKVFFIDKYTGIILAAIYGIISFIIEF